MTAPADLHAVRPVGPLTVAQKFKFALKRTAGLTGTKRVSILAGPARGVTMTLDFAGHTPMYLGMCEWELHRFVRYALEDAQLVLDVGGHVGYHALMFAANCAGEVITFESDPVQVRVLQDNIEQNPMLASRILVEPVAIAKEDAVGAATLDSISRRVGLPDFIKIDIDGGEADALHGAMEMLRAGRPHIVVETHSLALEQECGTLLAECGYRPRIKHNRRIWREHRAGAPHNRWLLATGRPRPS